MLVECAARREHDRDLALREHPQAATDLLASQFQQSEDRPRRGLTLLPLKPHREVPALEPPNLFLAPASARIRSRRSRTVASDGSSRSAASKCARAPCK